MSLGPDHIISDLADKSDHGHSHDNYLTKGTNKRPKLENNGVPSNAMTTGKYLQGGTNDQTAPSWQTKDWVTKSSLRRYQAYGSGKRGWSLHQATGIHSTEIQWPGGCFTTRPTLVGATTGSLNTGYPLNYCSTDYNWTNTTQGVLVAGSTTSLRHSTSWWLALQGNVYRQTEIDMLTNELAELYSYTEEDVTNWEFSLETINEKHRQIEFQFAGLQLEIENAEELGIFEQANGAPVDAAEWRKHVDVLRYQLTHTVNTYKRADHNDLVLTAASEPEGGGGFTPADAELLSLEELEMVNLQNRMTSLEEQRITELEGKK